MKRAVGDRNPLPWTRVPTIPLATLLFLALPLSIWQSPGADHQAVAILLTSLALLLGVAATGQRPYAWARFYFLAGVLIALSGGRLSDNELAGVLLLFLPLAVVLASSRAFSSTQRLRASLLALIFAGSMLATGSRGGLLAALITGGVILITERRWRLLFISLLVTGVWAASGPIDWLIHDGKVQGLTFDSLLTGRPEIWRRSLHAVADFAWTGVGLGAYPEIVPPLYFPPGTPPLEDAHQLAIQTALDLGVGGLLATLALIGSALARARAAHQDANALPVRRAWALGLFASLLAFVLFNLADAIALGSLGSIPFFFLLGLIFALPTPQSVNLGRWRFPTYGHRRLLVGILFILLGLPWIRDARQLNHATVLGARAIVHDSSLLPAAHTALKAASREICRAGWLTGKAAQAWNRPRFREDALADLLRCSAAFVPLIASELPDHRGLAEQAVEVQPSSAAAHFWLARLQQARDSTDAERLYRRGLELNPNDGQAWLALGRLLAPADPRAALDAFIQSCRHGDPGANACMAAGDTAEQLGDIERALRFYRKSRFHLARERAEQLLNPDGTDEF